MAVLGPVQSVGREAAGGDGDEWATADMAGEKAAGLARLVQESCKKALSDAPGGGQTVVISQHSDADFNGVRVMPASKQCPSCSALAATQGLGAGFGESEEAAGPQRLPQRLRGLRNPNPSRFPAPRSRWPTVCACLQRGGRPSWLAGLPKRERRSSTGMSRRRRILRNKFTPDDTGSRSNILAVDRCELQPDLDADTTVSTCIVQQRVK